MHMTFDMSYGMRMTCDMLCHTVCVWRFYVIRYAYDMFFLSYGKRMTYILCHTVCVHVYVIRYAYDM